MNWMKNLLARMAANRIKGDPHMKKALDWLQGKKSYIVAAAGIVAGILSSQGIVVPEWVLVLIGGVLGVTLKAGQSRTEELTKDLLDEIKKAAPPAAPPAPSEN